MDPVLTACLNMLGTNEHLLGKALEGLSPEDGWKQPGDTNPIHWIAGHMIAYVRKWIGGPGIVDGQ